MQGPQGLTKQQSKQLGYTQMADTESNAALQIEIHDVSAQDDDNPQPEDTQAIEPIAQEEEEEEVVQTLGNGVGVDEPPAYIQTEDVKEEEKTSDLLDLEEPKPIERSASSGGDTEHSKLIYSLLDEDQDVISVVKSDNPDSELNKIDKDWDYNVTYGDVEYREISDLPKGKTEKVWFPKHKSVRKVFVALKVKRVSDVDNVAETFRMRFHIYFNWLMTESDYRSFLAAQAAVDKEHGNYESLMKWEPAWYPHLEFQNAIEEHTKEWEVYPEQGSFRLQKFKDFGKKKKAKVPENEFDCEKARFIRAKLECEMTFAEELELQSFPFDCQDLSCIIHERTTGGVKCRFLPELRKPTFASIDPRYSVIDEWDLETAILEFGDANSSASRSKTSYAMIVLRLKMKRRWKVFLWNIVFLMMCICALALCSFSLGPQDLGDRLNLIITLVLTSVAFSYVVFDNLPNVPYLTYMDKYILCCYGFLVISMIQSAFSAKMAEAGFEDWIFFWLAFVVFIVYHAAFAWYALQVRKDEENKLYLSSDEVEREVNLSRPALEFDYTKRLRAGDNGRLLSFLGTLKIPKHMEPEQKAKLELQQKKLEEIYELRAQRIEGEIQKRASQMLSPKDGKKALLS